jgi:ABC-type multidrug transport system permease subunit
MSASTAVLPSPTVPRPLARDLRLAAHQVLDEQRTFWRNRSRAFFSFALPLMFLVIFAGLNHGDVLHDRGGIPADAFVVPGLLAYGVIMATFTGIATDLAVARDTGVLKRAQGTPLPAWAFVAGRVGSAVVVAALVSALTLLIAALGYGVHVPSSTIPGLVSALVVGTACCASLGIAVVLLIPNAEAAGAVTNGLVLPLTFISGVWGEFGGLPSWLHHLAQLFPIQHLANALQVAFDPRTTGAGIAGGDLLVLALWCAAGIVLGLRFLRAQLRRA